MSKDEAKRLCKWMESIEHARCELEVSKRRLLERAGWKYSSSLASTWLYHRDGMAVNEPTAWRITETEMCCALEDEEPTYD